MNSNKLAAWYNCCQDAGLRRAGHFQNERLNEYLTRSVRIEQKRDDRKPGKGPFVSRTLFSGWLIRLHFQAHHRHVDLSVLVQRVAFNISAGYLAHKLRPKACGQSFRVRQPGVPDNSL